MKTLRRWTLIAVLVYALAALAIGAVGLRDRIAPADAAVVLGNTVAPDGTPSARLQARLAAALDLYRRQVVPLIIVSGGTGREGVDEAQAMASALMQQGVPAAALIIDSAGVDTAATAANVARIARQRGLHSVLVVSQFFHLPRARLALLRAGVPVQGTVHARYFELRDAYALAREVPALTVYGLGLH